MLKTSVKRNLIAWAVYDFGSGAFSVLMQTFVFATYFVQSVAGNKADGAALWGLSIGLTGFFIAITSPVLGAIADSGGGRKAWLASCTVLCILSTGLTWFVYPNPSDIPLALVLICSGIIGSEFAYVFYNALLSELAPRTSIGFWSGIGWGLGYVGGTLSLVLAYILFFSTHSPFFLSNDTSAIGTRSSFLLAACWIIFFSSPLFLYLPKEQAKTISFSKACLSSFQTLKNTFSTLAKHKELIQFFIARIFYTDGLTTLFAFGGIYAAVEFNISQNEILLFGIFLNVSAGIGAGIFALFDDRLGSRYLITLSLICLIIFSSLALTTTDLWFFWVFCMLLGLFVGPIQASSRSYLARETPSHLQNQFFGFFSFTGKATSFLGPTLVGWITLYSKSLVLGMSVIVVFFALGLFLFIFHRPKLNHR